MQLNWDIPHWTTVRNWLLRVGLARLRAGQIKADDWVFLTDHAVQMGTEKCLVTLGIRQPDFQQLNRPLTLADMTLLQVRLQHPANKQTVHAELQELTQAVGDPLAVIHDNAADLTGGVKILKSQHPQVRSISDCKHKAACLLKKWLNKDLRWKEYQKQSGQSKKQLHQTELAFLAPPGLRSKARYMNLDRLVKWGEKALAVLDGKLELQPELKVDPQRLLEKLGWLSGFGQELNKWSEWLHTIEVVVVHIGRHGLSKATVQQLEEKLGKRRQNELGQELLEFVDEQAKQVKEGERLPGSTEVAESCMGKQKQLSGEHSKGGFTGLVLALGAVIGNNGQLNIPELLGQASIKDVHTWIKENLGITVQSARRRLGLAFNKAQQKRRLQHLPKVALL